MIEKKCSNCGITKISSEFTKDKQKRGGLSSYCRDCIRSRWLSLSVKRRRYLRKQWKIKNPDKWALAQRKCRLKTRYGLSPETYNKLLENQKFSCAICKSSTTKSKRFKYFLVDHDHKSGKVRGLLCDYCNRGLGCFEDSIERLEKAIGYIQNG